MPLLDCSMHMTKTLFIKFVSSDDFIYSIFGPCHSRKYLSPILLNLRIPCQVSVNDEGRDMWKVYLDMNEYAGALSNCRDPLQRDQVYLVQVRLIDFIAVELLVVLIICLFCSFFSQFFFNLLRTAYVYQLNLVI